MKKILIIAWVLTVVFTLRAEDRNSVLVTKQITRYQSSMIPDKTDEMKIQNLDLKMTGQNAQLKKAMLEILEQIVKTNYESPIFKVTVSTQPDHRVMLGVKSCDIMQEDAQGRKMIVGVLQVKNCYFIVQDTGNSENLVQEIFSKGRGKTKFERVFEYVEEILRPGGTLFRGMWNNESQAFDIGEFIINGNDTLHPAIEENSQEATFQY